MEDGKNAGAGDREERHRLGEAVDRRAPLLPEQKQDGGDERAGVADADPPDEIDDREAPADRDVDAPDADARDEELSVDATRKEQQRRRRRRSRGTTSCGVWRRTIAAILSVTVAGV